MHTHTFIGFDLYKQNPEGDGYISLISSALRRNMDIPMSLINKL